jgi:hypothetical protein
MLTKVLIATTYPLLLLAWLVNCMLGRDHLRLHDEPERSCWVKRRGRPDIASYFVETSCAEGGSEQSAAQPLIRIMRTIACLYTPTRTAAETVYKASADREQGIPDEVYTLW